MRVVKKKVAPPFKKAELEILYNEGISKEAELLDIGVTKNILKKMDHFIHLKENALAG
ncbi:MAG: hypothetical protein Ct9H90mP2_05260 [Dehalococcoidia bacterium]|nr:MAG: hypothetical protein Ct9H90mP2_05260 [Dehalococcoidia bacterium]